MVRLWFVSYVALWLLFLIVAVVLLVIFRNLAILYESIQAKSGMTKVPSNLMIGKVLPDVQLFNKLGVPVSTDTYNGGKTAFIVVNPTCSPCHALLTALRNGETNLDPQDPTFTNAVIVSVSEVSQMAAFSEKVGLHPDTPFLADDQNVIRRVWGVTATPTIVVVDDKQTVVRQVVGFPNP